VSWQATAWAAKQSTGSPACKLTLLALANYADASGACWPTQDTLAKDTEQSVDTVQRRLKKLVQLGLIRMERRPQGRGQWAGRLYLLNMPVAEMSEPQSAAWSGPEKADHHAATSTAAMPQPARRPCRTAVRHKPSIEQPIEPSAKAVSAALADRLQDFRGKAEGVEVVQNRIAQRLGADGWLILGEMSDAQRAHLTTLERRGQLDDAALMSVKRELAAKLGANRPLPPPAVQRAAGGKVGR